jgi:hypothetical protein
MLGHPLSNLFRGVCAQSYQAYTPRIEVCPEIFPSP